MTEETLFDALGQPVPERLRASKVNWLTRENLTAEERLNRRLGDAQLVADLRTAGFAGRDWEATATEFARYGCAVIGAWIYRGQIQRECAQKRIPAPPVPDELREDPVAIDSVTNEIVARASVAFRDEVLIPGVWDPDKGASLKTFFIGQCLKHYANAVRYWERHERPTRRVADANLELTLLDAGAPGSVADDVILSAAAESVIRGASSERAARALVMDACGYTNAEIASSLGTTVNAVKSLLKREHARIKTKKEELG